MFMCFVFWSSVINLIYKKKVVLLYQCLYVWTIVKYKVYEMEHFKSVIGKKALSNPVNHLLKQDPR
jgi:hypothetical protein